MDITKDQGLQRQILDYIYRNNLKKISSTDIIYNCMENNNDVYHSYYNIILLNLFNGDYIRGKKRISKRFSYILVDCWITELGIALLNDLIALSAGGSPDD